jgi:hypothetical protein
MINWFAFTRVIFSTDPRPSNRQDGDGFGAQTEVQPRVIGRIETRLGKQLLRLLPRAIPHGRSRADRAPIARRADELHLEPVIGAGQIVAQQV